MSSLTESMVTIATAIIGVAILAVIVSRNSNTTGVIQAAGSAFGNALGVAVSPVSGSKIGVDLSYPGGLSMGGFGGFPR